MKAGKQHQNDEKQHNVAMSCIELENSQNIPVARNRNGSVDAADRTIDANAIRTSGYRDG